MRRNMRSFFRKGSSISTDTTQGHKSHKITIQQLPLRPDKFDKDGRPQYCVDIYLDNHAEAAISKHYFYDPCSDRELSSCALYLNEMLKEGKYDAAIAQATGVLIKKYGQDLFKQLTLGELSEKLEHPKLDIQVKEAIRVEGSNNTIHRLRWEQLEDWDLWTGIKQPSVTVRRIVPQQNSKGVSNNLSLNVSQTPAPEKKKGRVNILLVIARGLEKKGDDYYEVDPGITLSAILRMKRTLEKDGSPDGYHIMLEVVRPGTFEAFKRHLESKPEGYFDIVHFDVHGEVNQSSSVHEPFLQFMSEDTSFNKLVEVPAIKIATELRKFKVPYAVLNACKSASPSAGDCGNLSHLFARQTSLKILAMSFNITGAAVKVLCEHFYRSFFADLQSFSEAASRARDALRRNRIRINHFPCIEVLDWFVPVTYAYTDNTLPEHCLPKRTLFGRSRVSLNSSLAPPPPRSSSGSSIKSFVSSHRGSSLHDADNFLRLRISDLEFERQIIRDNVIRLYGPSIKSYANSDSYIGYITDLWRITNFAEEPYVIEANVILDSDHDFKALWKAKEYIWGPCRSAQAVLPNKLVNWENTSSAKEKTVPRPVIIVDHADALFPSNPTQDQVYRRGQLNKFFEEILIEPKAQHKEFRAPFLIFVSANDIQNSSISHFPNLGGRKFLYEWRPVPEPYDKQAFG